jgi:hypothetical protein
LFSRLFVAFGGALSFSPSSSSSSSSSSALSLYSCKACCRDLSFFFFFLVGQSGFAPFLNLSAPARFTAVLYRAAFCQP